METAYIIRNGVIIGSGSSSSVGKDGVQIDDETASTDTVWSSQKTSDEIAEKVDKTNITTTIDSTSTDTQVPSAKAVNDILSTVTGITNARTYCLLSQLGITTPCTIKDIWDKMPSGSITIVDADSSIITDLDVIRIALGISDNDEVYGILTVVKLKQRTTLEFRRARTNRAMIPDTFIGYCKGNDCTLIQWKRMVITSVADVPMTTVSLDSSKFSSGSLRYEVKNGVCYVYITDLNTEATFKDDSMSSILMPMPSSGLVASPIVSETTGATVGLFYINSDYFGLMPRCRIFTSPPHKGYTTFSYPVAES